MRRRAELDAAYRATSYRVSLGDAVVDIRIDGRHPAVDSWLAGRGADRWAWISAANPGSQRLDAADNARRQGALLARLEAVGYPCAAGVSVADAGDWPPEQGALVAGIDGAAALALAREFAQNAVLLGDRGGVARLVWVADVAAP